MNLQVDMHAEALPEEIAKLFHASHRGTPGAHKALLESLTILTDHYPCAEAVRVRAGTASLRDAEILARMHWPCRIKE